MAPSDGATNPRLGLVLIGASDFPGWREQSNPAFARSARAFLDLMNDGAALQGKPAVCDLFDKALGPGEIVASIEDFVRDHRSITDLLIYYCGHGIRLDMPSKPLALMLPATRLSTASLTALTLGNFQAALQTMIARRRLFLVLDCCFSAYASKDWSIEDNVVATTIRLEASESLPRRGVALISAARGFALAPKDTEHTLFTGALVETLRIGLPGAEPYLSFREVVAAARTRIEQRYAQKAEPAPDGACPEVLALDQDDGDISLNRFFVNRAAPSDTTVDFDIDLLPALDDLLGCAAAWRRQPADRKSDFLAHRGSRLDEAARLRQASPGARAMTAAAADYLEACQAREWRERVDKWIGAYRNHTILFMTACFIVIIILHLLQ
jgi:hypothetical protein